MISILLLAMSVGQPPAESAYIPPNLYLVGAMTADTTPLPQGLTKGRFVVTHVYLGPATLQGAEFECSTSWPPFGSIRETPTEINVGFIQKGVEGLWWLARDAATGNYRPQLRLDVRAQLHIERFPSQKYAAQWAGQRSKRADVDDRFKEMLNWAKAAEALWNAKSDDQRATMLKKWAADDQAIWASWAVALLGRANKADDIAVLKHIIKEKEFTGAQQIAVDDVLCRIEGDKWRTSEERSRLIWRWFDGRADQSLVDAARAWLYRTTSKDFATQQFFRLLDHALAPENKLQAGQVYELARWLNEWKAPLSFEKCVQLAEDPRYSEIRYAGALRLSGLHRDGKLDGEQLNVIRRLRQEAHDIEVVKVLEWILQPPTPPGVPVAPQRPPPYSPPHDPTAPRTITDRQQDVPMQLGHPRRPAVPASLPPRFAVIGKVDALDRKIEIDRLGGAPIRKQRTEIVTVDGRELQRTVWVTEEQIVATTATLTADSFRVLDSNGREVYWEDAWDLLTPGRMVLEVWTTGPIDPAYLKLLSKDALIIAGRAKP